jgi:hypothetical protein
VFVKLIILLAFVVSASGQQPCSLTAATSPAISGFRLGMSYADVQQVLGPSIKVKPAKTGEGTVFESFAEAPAPERLSGVQAFWLRFANNRVYQIEVFYAGSASKQPIEDLTAHLSKEFKLPAEEWKIKNNLARIECGEVLLTADTILNPHVELTDTTAKSEFDKKQADAKKSSKKKESKKTTK